MKSLPILVLCLPLFACGTADAGSDAPSAHFSARSESLFAAQAVPGDLSIEVTNSIPKISVPEPHLPTVIHLNASLCSEAPGPYKTTFVDDNGATQYTKYSGSRRCLDLSPTVFFDSSMSFTVKNDDVNGLINEDYSILQLRFKSSSQTTSVAYECRSNIGRIKPRPDKVNELKVTVDGQHSLAFNCRDNRN